jgi:hypothetical protein
MSSEPPQESAQRPDGAARYEATVVVRGEHAGTDDPKSSAAAPPQNKDAENKDKKPSPAKLKMQSDLPALADDAQVGIPKDQRVIRDGKADLAFLGTLRASAAPPSAPQGQWAEYRIYETAAGKHVFSKVTRHVNAEQDDTHEAEIFDPTPDSVPSKLLRSAHDLTHSRPMTWEDAAIAFFGYDPVAKALYRKISGGRFEEQIS